MLDTQSVGRTVEGRYTKENRVKWTHTQEWCLWQNGEEQKSSVTSADDEMIAVYI
jgi:hypothetical protein